MKFNKLIYTGLAVAAMTMVSCSNFTEITPKGENLLNKVSDLELLLGGDWDGLNSMQSRDVQALCGDVMNRTTNIANMISQGTKTSTSIFFTYDEDGHKNELPGLTNVDALYTDCYSKIGKIANPILQNIDKSTGDDKLRKQVKAEALVIRAYMHYIVAQKFAKAYNPATAAEEPCIIYMKETTDILAKSPLNTQQEVYENIIKDLDEAIALNALPEKATNRMRWSLPCAYAAKALAYMSMQKFDEAAEAAKKALSINDVVDNYNEMLEEEEGDENTYMVLSRPRYEAEEDYFCFYYIIFDLPMYPEAEKNFEAGHVSHEKMYSGATAVDYVPGANVVISKIGEDWFYPNDIGYFNNMGLRTTQMWLILAEIALRNNNIDEAMDICDKIRVNRIDPDVYAPLRGVVKDKATAMKHFKQTSFGENVYTYYNFVNRKRWTQIPDFCETPSHTYDGVTYTLRPDSPMWVFPFPENVKINNPNVKDNY